MVNYILDGILAVIALIAIIYGIKTGAFKLLLVTFNRLFAIILGVLLTKVIAPILTEQFFSGFFANVVLEKIDKSDADITCVEDLVNILPSWMKMACNMIKYDYDTAAETAYASPDSKVKTFIELISSPITNILSTIITFIILFFVSILLIKLLVAITKKLFELPIIKQVNCILGGAAALVFAFLFVYVLLKIFLFVQKYTSLNLITEELVEQTYIFKYLYNFDLLKFIFTL